MNKLRKMQKMEKYMVLEIFKFQKSIARDFENFQILKKMQFNFGSCQKKEKKILGFGNLDFSIF